MAEVRKPLQKLEQRSEPSGKTPCTVPSAWLAPQCNTHSPQSLTVTFLKLNNGDFVWFFTGGRGSYDIKHALRRGGYLPSAKPQSEWVLCHLQYPELIVK